MVVVVVVVAATVVVKILYCCFLSKTTTAKQKRHQHQQLQIPNSNRKLTPTPPIHFKNNDNNRKQHHNNDNETKDKGCRGWGWAYSERGVPRKTCSKWMKSLIVLFPSPKSTEQSEHWILRRIENVDRNFAKLAKYFHRAFTFCIVFYYLLLRRCSLYRSNLTHVSMRRSSGKKDNKDRQTDRQTGRDKKNWTSIHDSLCACLHNNDLFVLFHTFPLTAQMRTAYKPLLTPPANKPLLISPKCRNR